MADRRRGLRDQLWKTVLQVLLFPVPWPVRRKLLCRLLEYDIARSARIGCSVILARSVTLDVGAQIGHGTMLRGLDEVMLGRHASIGSFNWIYAIPRGYGYFEDTARHAALRLEEGATITRRHVVDCSDTVTLRRLALVAGYATQILTHSVSLSSGKQGVRPIEIGEACFVGSRCIVLGGSRLPHHSALVAGSTLRNDHDVPYRIYAGVLAEEIGVLNPDAGFFTRPTTGWQ